MTDHPHQLYAIEFTEADQASLVACIRTGRRFIGIELDQEYFEIAKKRIRDELARHPLLEAVAS